MELEEALALMRRLPSGPRSSLSLVVFIRVSADAESGRPAGRPRTGVRPHTRRCARRSAAAFPAQALLFVDSEAGAVLIVCPRRGPAN